MLITDKYYYKVKGNKIYWGWNKEKVASCTPDATTRGAKGQIKACDVIPYTKKAIESLQIIMQAEELTGAPATKKAPKNSTIKTTAKKTTPKTTTKPPTTVYEKSNQITTIKGRITKETKALYKKISEAKTNWKAADVRKFYERLCKDLKMPALDLIISNTPRPYKITLRGESQTHAFIYVVNYTPMYIKLFTQTAKRRQQVAGKTLLKALVHEVSHQYDFFKLGFSRSPHTAGFYKRVTYLINKLENKA